MTRDEDNFIQAIRGNHFKKVVKLVEAGVNIEVRFEGKTALMWAAFLRHAELVELLLEHRAKVNAVSKDGGSYTPLLLALTDAKNDPDVQPYKDAARREKIVKMLLEKGAKPNVRNIHFLTPLYQATAGNSPSIVFLLIEHGADTNNVLEGGMSLLELAAECGVPEIVKRMLQQKTTRAQRVKALSSALDHPEIARMILDNISDDSERIDALSYSLFGACCSDETLPMTKLLLEQGANINTQSEDIFWTPLFFATEEPAIETIRYLLKMGADQTLKTADGFTPYTLALYRRKGSEGKELVLWQSIVDIFENHKSNSQ